MRAARYALAVAAAAVAGGAATSRGTGRWYTELDRPSWTPPSRVFGPVWTALYTQMAVSAWLVERSGDERSRTALRLWWLQLGLNTAWSPLFFGAHRIRAAAAVAAALVPAVAATGIASARIRPAAGAAYAPYLAWSTFAAALTAELARRNA